MKLTSEIISTATGSHVSRATTWQPYLQATCDKFGIDTPRRVVGFLSQIGHESGGLARLSENLDYSVEALLKLFGRHRISVTDATRHGRTRYQKADQQALANILYGGEWGRKNLGNTEPGDGWRFRGRGLKQLTGRANYAAASAALSVDFVTDPDLVLMPQHAADTSGWFWSKNGLNAAADRGDVAAMTRIINGGSMGLEQRMVLYRGGMGALA